MNSSKHSAHAFAISIQLYNWFGFFYNKIKFEIKMLHICECNYAFPLNRQLCTATIETKFQEFSLTLSFWQQNKSTINYCTQLSCGKILHAKTIFQSIFIFNLSIFIRKKREKMVCSCVKLLVITNRTYTWVNVCVCGVSIHF